MVTIPDRIGVVLVDTFGVPYTVGSGGVSQADNSAFTQGTSSGTPSMFIVDDTATSAVSENAVGVARMTTSRIQMIGGDIANDIADAGNPLKVGGRAQNTPTAVTDGDRVDLWANRLGAPLVSFDGPGNAGSDVITNVSFPSLRTATSAGGSASAVNSAMMMYDGSTNWVRTRGDAANGMDVDVTRLPALVAGTANIGDVDVLTVPTDPFGANADASSASGSISAKLRFIASTGIPVTSGTITTVSTVTSVTAIANALPAGTNAIGKLAANSGVDIGDVDVTSIAAGSNLIGDVAIQPRTTGGWTTHHAVAAGSTNATNVKNGAGQLGGFMLTNTSAAFRKIAFHNSSSTPTAGASVYFSYGLAAGASANVEFTAGIPFSAGIGYTLVTGVADSDSAAVTANDLIVNLFYK